MPYPGAHTFPGARTFPGVISDPYIIDAAPPAPTLDDLLAGPRRLSWRLTAWKDGFPVVRDGEPVRVPFTAGSITVHDGLPTRDLSGLAVPGEEWVPAGMARHVLDPDAGHELHIEVGLSDPAVGEHWWDVMVADLGAADVSVTDDGGRGPTVSLSAPDRSERVSTALILSPPRVEPGTPAEVAVANTVASTGAGVPVDLVSIGGLVSSYLSVGEPGKDVLSALTETIGMPRGLDVRVTPSGSLLLRPVRDPNLHPPQWTYRVGGDVPVFAASRRLRRSIGAVLVPWAQQPTDEEQAGPLPSGIVAVPDAHTLPRAWWDGDASTINSETQAREAGQAWLTKQQAGAERPSMTVLYDPRVEVGDIVRVEHERIGVAATCRVVEIKFNLGGDLMDLTLANRRLDTFGAAS